MRGSGGSCARLGTGALKGGGGSRGIFIGCNCSSSSYSSCESGSNEVEEKDKDGVVGGVVLVLLMIGDCVDNSPSVSDLLDVAWFLVSGFLFGLLLLLLLEPKRPRRRGLFISMAFACPS